MYVELVEEQANYHLFESKTFHLFGLLIVANIYHMKLFRTQVGNK